MDWSTNDYTRVYGDTFITPEQEQGEGVYLLDEAARATDGSVDPRIRVPIRPADGRGARYGRPARYAVTGTPYNEYRTREGFHGNIISDRGNNRRVFDAAWDERPMHYNPNAGPEWAHLVPPPHLRPHGGGPAPSLAFPMITHSEAIVSPKDRFRGDGERGGCGACQHRCKGEQRATDLCLKYVVIILLVVIVVLLAMTLTAAGRIARTLEKTVKTAVGVLGSVARGEA